MTESGFNQASGLYIDVENLRSGAKELIVASLKTWPCTVPFPTKIVLYVPANMVELWKFWADTNINGQMVDVRGIQHFTAQQSKNSADIAIAVEAISDLLNGLVHHVAVFSDDSDFISLFSKIKAESEKASDKPNRIPFLWVLTDRYNTKTSNIVEFFPSEYLYIVRDDSHTSPSQTSVMSEQIQPSNSSSKSKSQDELVAEAIIQEMDIREFKSSDCQEIVKSRFPNHPGVNQLGAAFGGYIAGTIWPLLEARGVELVGSGPRIYKMTQAAKDSLIPLDS